MVDLLQLRTDFINYLTSNGTNTNQQVLGNNNDTSIFSIFKDEFREYLSETYNYNDSIFSMDLNNLNNLFNSNYHNNKMYVSPEDYDYSNYSDIEEYSEEETTTETTGLFDISKWLNAFGFGKKTETEENENSKEQNITSMDTGSIKGNNTESATVSTNLEATPQNNGVTTNNNPFSLTTTPTTNNTSLNIQEKNLENLNKDELKAELGKAKNTLSSGKDIMSSIMDGSDSNLQSLQANIDTNYEAYQEALKNVDEDMAKQVDDLKKQIDTKQTEINAKEMEITNQEIAVSDAESAYNDAQNTTSELEASLADLESTDTSEMEDDEKAALEAQISALKSEVEAAKQAEEAAKAKLEEAKNKLEELKAQKEELISGSGGLNELNQQMTELETQIAEKYPEIQEYLNAYNEAKQEYDSYKSEATTSIKEELQNAQNYINEINTEISTKETKETKSKYGLHLISSEKENPETGIGYNAKMGNLLAEAAETTRGTQGFCLAGVNDSIEEIYGQRLSFFSAYQATDALRGEVAGYEKLASNFIEKDVAREDLANLPAGAIVVWDNIEGVYDGTNKEHGHISIALGDGRESSDHTREQLNLKDRDYTVFYPI